MVSSKRVPFALLAGVLLLPLSASAGPLSIVQVSAPSVNCLFNTTCKVTATDSIGTLPAIPSLSGASKLQSRTFPPAPATAKAAGKTAYLYRMDMTQAKNVSAGNPPSCMSKLMLDIGPVMPLPYATTGAPAAVFVVTQGGLGSVGLASAEQKGNIVTFTFSKPVCAGETSYFFGLAASGKPSNTAGTAIVLVPGEAGFEISGRVPAH